MTDQQRERIKKIQEICAITDPAQSAWLDRAACQNDVLWLIQLIEVQEQHIDALASPEWVGDLLKRFAPLNKSNKMLMLELMRGLQEKAFEDFMNS